MTTAADIAQKALLRMGVITFDNAADAGIQAQAESSLTDLHEMFISLPTPLVDWELTNIPSYAVGPLVNELAWYMRDDFQLSDAKRNSLQVAQAISRRELQALIHVPDDGEPTEINAY